MELAWTAGGILVGGAAMYIHMRRVAGAMERERQRSLQELRKAQDTKRKMETEIRFYVQQLTARDLERAAAEGFVDGCLYRQNSSYNEDGLQQMAERLGRGEPATVWLKKRRMGTS